MSRNQFITLLMVMVLASFLGGMFGATLFSGGASGETLAVRELRVVDEAGNPRIFLGIEGISTVMKMYGEGKSYRAFPGADSMGASLAMYGLEGRGVPGMGVYSDGVGFRRHDNAWRNLRSP